MRSSCNFRPSVTQVFSVEFKSRLLTGHIVHSLEFFLILYISAKINISYYAFHIGKLLKQTLFVQIQTIHIFHKTCVMLHYILLYVTLYWHFGKLSYYSLFFFSLIHFHKKNYYQYLYIFTIHFIWFPLLHLFLLC